MQTPTATTQPGPRTLRDRMPPRWLLLTLLCLALVVRGRIMLANLESLQQDPDGYREIAWSLYSDGMLGRWNDQTRSVEPTASRPPLYPLLLSSLYYLRSAPIRVSGSSMCCWERPRCGSCGGWGLLGTCRRPASLLARGTGAVRSDPAESIRARHDRNAGRAAGRDRAVGLGVRGIGYELALVRVGRRCVGHVRAVPAGVLGLAVCRRPFCFLGWRAALASLPAGLR